MNVYVSIELDTEKLYQKLECAIDYFKDAESRQLNDVDIDECYEDYINTLLIFDESLIKKIT